MTKKDFFFRESVQYDIACFVHKCVTVIKNLNDLYLLLSLCDMFTHQVQEASLLTRVIKS